MRNAAYGDLFRTSLTILAMLSVLSLLAYVVVILNGVNDVFLQHWFQWPFTQAQTLENKQANTKPKSIMLVPKSAVPADYDQLRLHLLKKQPGGDEKPIDE